MQFYSTNRRSPSASFREAALFGQPPDGGLYFPEKIPVFERKAIDKLKELSKAEAAFEMIRLYAEGDIPEEKLFEICRETVDFDFPLVQIKPGIWALELFHGETLAFKDVGARFMSRCLGYFAREVGQRVLVVAATSGDTGGAVAKGFFGVPGVEVVVIYPSGRVSALQELQLASLGGNISALELEGSFDDCQRIAKEVLRDEGLKKLFFITSANSINIARWLPQQFYYAFALQQWDAGEAPLVSVPSGNFGNLSAGLLAKKSGLRLGRFIAACNENDVVPRFLENGKYDPLPAIQTVSNAMDVGDPSNFARIVEIYSGDNERLRNEISGLKISDQETKAAIIRVFEESGYMLDPHGAVGLLALERLKKENEAGFFLETAHPIKFDVVEQAIGRPMKAPRDAAEALKREKRSYRVGKDYGGTRAFIEALASR